MINNKDKPKSKNLAEFLESIEQDKGQDKKIESFKQKKLIVEDYKVTNELERIRKNEEDLKLTSKVNVGIMSDDVIADIQEKSRAYFEGAKNGMTFLHEEFRKWVPCWAGNIILVGARTGGGKSSLTGNLILSTIQQKNPITLKNRKVLCISAEETPAQVFGRITCLVKNYNFNEQDEFTEEQKKDMIDYIPVWANNGVSVIGEDGHGNTSTLEGIDSILKNLITTKTHYDLILFDYIQKATTSKKNPYMKPHEVIKAVMGLFDSFKNVYPGAIVILTQLSANNEEETIDFQERLRGCHDMITPCTVALELVPDVKLLRSRFIVRKNRYKGSTLGGHVDMGYDRGKFVPYTDEFVGRTAEQRDSVTRENTYGKHVDGEKDKTEEKND